jgi:hypothetical protein
MRKIGSVFFLVMLLISGNATAQLRFLPLRDSASLTRILRVVPQNFYTTQLSFVCKKEHQLQRLTSLPLFIRAGSKDYVDYLERKPNAVWLPKQ